MRKNKSVNLVLFYRFFIFNNHFVLKKEAILTETTAYTELFLRAYSLFGIPEERLCCYESLQINLTQ